MSIKNISANNSEFWNELCGTGLAKFLGISDSSPESLKKFDDWYMDFYPYLNTHIPFGHLSGKDVLEVGLGYGTVSQKLVESGALYSGLDIAQGPVDMVNLRISRLSGVGSARRGSILEPEFKPESFDYIVAIGCLHHTGDLQKAINNCHSLLRPGGKLIFMVYYAYSYRRFRMAPIETIRNLVREVCGFRGVVGASSDLDRAAYDKSSDGSGAPHTDWISKRSLEYFCRNFSNFISKTENIDQEPPFKRKKRVDLLKTRWPNLIGLDLYASATK